AVVGWGFRPRPARGRARVHAAGPPALAGNRTNAGYQTNAGNRLSTDGTWNYTYDNEGNLTKKVNISSGQTWNYNYNQLNQLLVEGHRVAFSSVAASFAAASFAAVVAILRGARFG